MRTLTSVVALSVLVVTLVCGTAVAQSTDGEKRQTRIDVGVFLQDFTEGGESYGPWYGSRVRALSKPAPGTLGFTGILDLVAEKHQDRGAETSGLYAAGGGYYDLGPNVFTFTAVGLGSADPFPQVSLHQEINFKVTQERQLVIGGGAGYVDYHNVNQATYLAIGSSYYWQGGFKGDPNAVVQYQFRRYFANPVDEKLNTHILTFALGWAPHNWTRFLYMHGQELFRVGGGTVGTFDASLSGQVFMVEHERLVRENFGVVVAVDLMHKRDRAENEVLFTGPGIELRLFWRM